MESNPSISSSVAILNLVGKLFDKGPMVNTSEVFFCQIIATHCGLKTSYRE